MHSATKAWNYLLTPSQNSSISRFWTWTVWFSLIESWHFWIINPRQLDWRWRGERVCKGCQEPDGPGGSNSWRWDHTFPLWQRWFYGSFLENSIGNRGAQAILRSILKLSSLKTLDLGSLRTAHGISTFYSHSNFNPLMVSPEWPHRNRRMHRQGC